MKIYWVRFERRGCTYARFVDAYSKKKAKRMVKGKVLEVARIT